MDWDEAVQEGLRRSNTRFLTSINRILEQYNHPFEDDLVVSLDTLTYDTPEGPKRWGQVSRKDVKKWKKEIFKHNRRRRRNTEISKQRSSDFEDEHSTLQQESSEISGVDTSDTGGESGDRVSERRKLEDIQLQNLNVDDGQIQKKGGVQLDLLVQDVREMPNWVKITPPRLSRGHRLPSPAQELFGGESGDRVSERRKLEDIQLQNLNVGDVQIQKKGGVQLDLLVQDVREMPSWVKITPPMSSRGHRLPSPAQELFGGESRDRVSERRKLEDIHLQNLNVDGRQMQKKGGVQLDLLVQDVREMPKWIKITPPRLSRGHRLPSPAQELFGGESRDRVSERRKLEDIHLQNLNVDGRQMQKKGGVQLDLLVQDVREMPKWIKITPPRLSRGHRLPSPAQELFGGESGDRVSVRRKLEDIHLQNLNVGDGQIQKKGGVQLDLLVQDVREMPNWVKITPPRLSRGHCLPSPAQELFGGESGDRVSVRRKLEDIHLQNLNVGDGQIQKKGGVQLDLLVQDVREMPNWVKITPPRLSRGHRLPSPAQELFGGESGDRVSVRRKLEDIHLQNLNVDDGQIQKKGGVQLDLLVQDVREMPNWVKITPPMSSRGHRLPSPAQELFGGESGDIASVRRKLEDIHLQNLNVDDGQIQKKGAVQLDLIVQADEIMMTPPMWSRGHRLASPTQELFGNQAVVCRKKLELSNECASSKYLQLQYSDVPSSSNKIASPRHQPCPELSSTLCDSIHEGYQSAGEECSWSNTTLADLYPAMLEIFTKLMAKHSQRKVLKYMFGHLRSKRWHSRRPKLNVTLDKTRGFRLSKLKKTFRSTCSYRNEDDQSPTFGHEGRELFCDNCLISNSSGLVSYASPDTDEIKMGYSNSSLEHLTSGKGQEVCKHTAFPDVMDRMGETFLFQDELQTATSPKNSEYTESEKLDYKYFSEPSFITSTASSDSRALHLVKETETQKTEFCVDTSELHSSACSSPGNRNNSLPIPNCSPTRSSNTAFIYPEKIISVRQSSFQHKGLFSSWFMKPSPSKMCNEYQDAFEQLYYQVCSEDFQKSLMLTRPLINSQNLEEKGRLVKNNLGDFRQSMKQRDTEFDRIYEKLCRKSVPKFPGFQTASNFRKYEEIQMPETVNALVNSPVRTYSAISRVKRRENFQNYLLCSPVKRLKLTPGHSFSSKKCQKVSPSKKGHLQTAGMDNCSNPHFFGDHSSHCQGSGYHDSSDKSFLGVPGTSLQESGTAGVHPGWPGAVENCSSLRNVRKHHRRVYRKLSYTDEKDQL